MIAAIDNTFLTLLLNPKATPRPNPATGEPTEHCRLRIEGMVDDLSKNDGTLIVPAPALAEALCMAEAAEAYMERLQEFAAIEVAPFDMRAAYELGRVVRAAIANGDKRSGETGDWQHVKMDRAIVAIAAAQSVEVFYSDDDRQTRFAESAGLRVVHTWELSLPHDKAQKTMMEGNEAEWPKHPRPPKSTSSVKPPDG